MSDVRKKRAHPYTHVLAGDGLDDIFWRRTEKLRDDRELVDVYERTDGRAAMRVSRSADTNDVGKRSVLTVLAREERLALEHLCEDASCAPDVDCDVVLLPCEHDLGCAVVAGGDVAGHLGVLQTGEAEVADLWHMRVRD